jgi:NADP-dependent 3-hydroxy acid dehydrogenase YdfG
MILKNKTILITGATSGIGKATAELFAKDGARLILVGRRADRLKNLADGLKVETHRITLDVRDRAAIEAAMDDLPDEWRAIDVLVNNAGLALDLSSADAANLDDWEVMIDTNIRGLITLTRLILPGMKERKFGHIVNISSTAGNYQYPGSNVYGATKAFVSYFSLALRADLLGSPVRVTNIEPGMTETEFSQVRFKGDAGKAGDVYKGLAPLQAENIAAAILFAVTQPAHVNINRMEIMPVMQAPGGPLTHRG